MTLLVCSAQAQDLVAIERLHQLDIAAAKAGDIATLATLWTDDAVALPPGAQPVIGIDAIREWLKQGQESGGRFEITEYRIDFQETRVLCDETIEWGRIRVSMRPKGGQGSMTPVTFCAYCGGSPMAPGRSHAPYGTWTRQEKSRPGGR